MMNIYDLVFPSSCFNLLDMHHPLARCRYTLTRRLNPSYPGFFHIFLQLFLASFSLSSNNLYDRDSAGDHVHLDSLALLGKLQ